MVGQKVPPGLEQDRPGTQSWPGTSQLGDFGQVTSRLGTSFFSVCFGDLGRKWLLSSK